jgi:hypothetical protein
MHEHFVYPRFFSKGDLDAWDRRALMEWFKKNVGEENVDWGIGHTKRMLDWYYYWFKDPKHLTFYLLKWGNDINHRPHPNPPIKYKEELDA